MAAPVWYTTTNNLGVIQEGQFYQFPLDARDPSSYPLSFSVVSGKLPDGIELANNGTIFGNPRKVVQGVPVEVSRDITDTFTVRAKSYDNIVNDKTFSLTVTGQDVPIWGIDSDLGTALDFQYINKKLSVTDPDSEDTLTYELLSGTLPPGTELTKDGFVTGFIQPLLVESAANTGSFDYTGVGFDTALFDSGSNNSSYSRQYRFVVRVTDGKAFIVKEFTLYVFGGFDLKADSDEIYADKDDGLIQADTSSEYGPVIRHSKSEIGTFLHDNRFNFKVDAIDYSNEDITYSIYAGDAAYDAGPYDSELFDAQDGALPPGLTIDPGTGWIHGTLPFLNVVRQNYRFIVKAARTSDPGNFFDTHEFTMTVVSNKNLDITWITPTNLGTIQAGAVSTLFVEAENKNNQTLIYELENNSKLPQGLTLNARGEIAGRVSFKTFQLDRGTTTIDNNNTTIDGTYKFTVKARDNTDTVSNTRTFELVVKNEYSKPYEDLYIDLLPTDSDRTVWEEMVFNRQDIPDKDLYRSTDLYFGRQENARMLFLPGLPPKTLAEFFKAVYRNHHEIDLRFGEFKYAKATDNDNNHIYDVVYVDVLDKFDPTPPSLANLSITYDSINNPVTADESAHVENTNLNASVRNNRILYPASLQRMKRKVEAQLGIMDSRTLPRWMTSVQEDGTVLGYTPACVVAYLKPGAGKRVLYYLNINTGIDLNKIKFTVDRYVVDQYFSTNYDKTANPNAWTSSAETTFDSTDMTLDGDNTKFFSNIDTKRSKLTDGNSYVKFPRDTITDLP